MPPEFRRFGSVVIPGDPNPEQAAYLARLPPFVARRRIATAVLGGPRGCEAAAQAIGLPNLGKVASSADVIAALRHIDVQPLLDAGIEPIAVLDFDNTLMRGDLLETFLHFCGEIGALYDNARYGALRELRKTPAYDAGNVDWESLTASELASAVAEQYAVGELTGYDFNAVAVRLLRGLSDDELDALGKKLFSEGSTHIAPYKDRALTSTDGYPASTHELVNTLRRVGVRPIIITAGIRGLAAVGARCFDIPVSDVYGVDPDVGRNGRFSGGNDVMTQDGKRRIIRMQIGTPPLFAFGDSPRTDAAMLREALVRGFMVNPQASFLEHARTHHRAYTSMVF